MFKKFFLIFLFIFSTQVFAENLIWNSNDGLEKLKRSHFNNDFYQLVNFYQPQINPFFCSAATSVIILNALDYGNIPSQKELEAVRPESEGGALITFSLYSQKTFFNAETDKIKNQKIIEFKAPKETKSGKEIYDPGLALDDLSKILRKVYKLKVTAIHAEKNNQKFQEKFRATAKKILADKNSFLIVNFDGTLLGHKTHGHISPLAAYDEKSDSLLVLDVALHKNQWFWIPLPELFAAMNTQDNEIFRGYMVVSR